MYNGSKLIS